MQERLLTYAVLRTMYEEDRDPREILEPFVLEALSSQPITKNAIRTAILRSHGFEIPNHVISVVLSRLTAQDLVQEKGDKYRLAAGQPAYRQLDDQLREIERQANALALDGKEFLARHGLNVSEGQFLEALDALLLDNVQQVLATIKPTDFRGTSSEVSEQTKILILAYLTEVERSKPSMFAIVEKFIAGALTSIVLRSKIEAEDLPFEKGKVEFFLDSNFVFFLLGLHGSEAVRAAEDILKMLNDARFDAYVLDVTVNEIARVLLAYDNAAPKFSSAVETDHIYSQLKKWNWSGSDAIEFVGRLEAKLAEHDLQVVPTAINLRSFVAKDQAEAQRLAQYRFYRSEVSRKHDLAIIDFIRQRRGSRSRIFSQSKCFFLTSDWGLAKFNSVEGGHQSDATVVEVILDVTLANLLWMRNPNVQVSMKTLVAASIQSGVVSNSLWQSLRTQLEKLKRSGRITESDFEALFYQSFAQKELQKFDARGKLAVSENDVDAIIERAKAVREVDLKSQVDVARQEALREASQLAAELSSDIETVRRERGQIARDKASLERLVANMQEGQRKLASRVARQRAFWVVSALRAGVLLISSGVVAVVVWSYGWTAFGKAATVGGILVAVAGAQNWIAWNDWKESLERRFYATALVGIQSPSNDSGSVGDEPEPASQQASEPKGQ